MKNFRVKRLGHLPKVTVAKWQNLGSNPRSVSREQLAVRREGKGTRLLWRRAERRWAALGAAGQTAGTALHTGQRCKLQFKCDLLYFSAVLTVRNSLFTVANDRWHSHPSLSSLTERAGLSSAGGVHSV